MNGFGGLFSQPFGYIIIRVQVGGVRDYDEDQVALVIPDSTIFGSQVLVTVGTLTINQIINMIKESEIDDLWVHVNPANTAGNCTRQAFEVTKIFYNCRLARK